MAIQCPNCNEINRDTAKFCNNCGSKLISAPSETGSREKDIENGISQKKPTPDFNKNVDREQSKPDIATIKEQYESGAISYQKYQELLSLYNQPQPASSKSIKDLLVKDLFAEDTPVKSQPVNDLPVRVKPGSPSNENIFSTKKTAMGIVTHLHQWDTGYVSKKPFKGHIPNYLFDLRLTDKNWIPLIDKRGYLMPTVEVEFRTSQVHGPTLEEGSRVVLKGKLKKSRFKVEKIWNQQKTDLYSLASGLEAYWGRITNYQARQISDIRFPRENRTIEIRNFRLQHTNQNFQELNRDENGNLIEPLPVEIRAQVISGQLSDGDKVEVRGQMVGGILYSNEVVNHSAGGVKIVIKEWAGIP